MTHDELKSKIDEMHYFGGLGNKSQFYNVIRQVVQLHKPIGTYCEACIQSGIEHPCPTIQAIEKGLR